MDKYIYNEQNELWYELQGDYYLPCLKLPEEEAVHIGIWGQRHRRYLKTHRKALYTSLLTSGKLNGYLADIDRQAEEMFSRLVKQLSEKEGVTETLKVEMCIRDRIYLFKVAAVRQSLKTEFRKFGQLPLFHH